jgi:hypothetical protein
MKTPKRRTGGYLREGRLRKKLDSVRLATGELDSSEEGVKREVTSILRGVGGLSLRR